MIGYPKSTRNYSYPTKYSLKIIVLISNNIAWACMCSLLLCRHYSSYLYPIKLAWFEWKDATKVLLVSVNMLGVLEEQQMSTILSDTYM